MKLNGGACPSLETIGAFVDDRLKDRERETIADHLATCETCYFVFSEAARTRVTQQVPVAVPISRFTWRYAAAGLAAAATLLLAVNVWQSSGPSAEERALTNLVAAVGTARTFEPRLTGGFAYAPVRGPVRGAGNVALTPDTRIAIAEIEKQFAARPIAGTAAIIAGDPNRAIPILEKASGDNPNDAKLLSDVSAAYLVIAERDNSKDAASRALAMANRALEIDRLMPEALFNRALALQLSGLNEDAKVAWQAYLTIDDRSGWADEARARLRILSNQP